MYQHSGLHGVAHVQVPSTTRVSYLCDTPEVKGLGGQRRQAGREREQRGEEQQTEEEERGRRENAIP